MEFRIAYTVTASLARLTADKQKEAKTTAADLQKNLTCPPHSCPTGLYVCWAIGTGGGGTPVSGISVKGGEKSGHMAEQNVPPLHRELYSILHT